MHSDNDLNQDPLSSEESKAFKDLQASKILPGTMEDKTVNELIIRKLIQKGAHSTIPWWRYVGGAAAAFFLFWVGFWIGQLENPSPTPAGDTYMLLLHEKRGTIPANDPQIGQEYGNWVRSLPTENAFVGGSELDPKIQMVGSWDPSDEADISSGYFMIRAASLKEATNVAQQCPHLNYGGSIEIRKIVQH